MLICKRYADALLPRTAHILKGLYDLDIVDETVLIEWHEKVEKVGSVNFNFGVKRVTHITHIVVAQLGRFLIHIFFSGAIHYF